MKIPEHFDWKINLQKALGNAAAVVLLLTLCSITNPVALGAGFAFGLLGGSINDIIGWMGNKEAIVAHAKSKEDQ